MAVAGRTCSTPFQGSTAGPLELGLPQPCPQPSASTGPRLSLTSLGIPLSSFCFHSCFSSVGKFPKVRVCLPPAGLPLPPAPASGPLHFLFPLPEPLLPQILYHFFLASDAMIPQHAASPCLLRDTHTLFFWSGSPALDAQCLQVGGPGCSAESGGRSVTSGEGRDRARTLFLIL